MTKLEDVVRWSADPDAPAGMRELIRTANAADPGPSAEAIASVHARVVAQLAPKAALLSVRALIVGALVVGAGAGIVGYALTRPEHRAARVESPARAESPAVARVEPPAIARAAPPAVEPNIAPVPPATPVPPPSPVPPVAPRSPAPPPSSVITQRPASPPKPAVHAATPSGVPAAIPPPVPAAPAVEAAPAPPVVEPPPAPPPQPAVSEVTLLEQARVALRGGDSARALELATRHATAYPDGALAEEREALAIEALAKLGRHADAAARWANFASSYPHSNYRARLQRLIENSR